MKDDCGTANLNIPKCNGKHQFETRESQGRPSNNQTEEVASVQTDVVSNAEGVVLKDDRGTAKDEAPRDSWIQRKDIPENTPNQRFEATEDDSEWTDGASNARDVVVKDGSGQATEKTPKYNWEQQVEEKIPNQSAKHRFWQDDSGSTDEVSNAESEGVKDNCGSDQ